MEPRWKDPLRAQRRAARQGVSDRHLLEEARAVARTDAVRPGRRRRDPRHPREPRRCFLLLRIHAPSLQPLPARGSAMTSLDAGTRLGAYEILGPLGAGGMGQVYRARDARLGRDIAIKVLPGELSKDPERLARFEREAPAGRGVFERGARGVRGFSVPQVGGVFDVGRESGVVFLVTELVGVWDLRSLPREGGLPAESAVEIAAQVAEGLAAAHEKGI